MNILTDIQSFFKLQESNGYFLVDVKFLPQQKLVIYADNNNGISVSECAILHRQLAEAVPALGDYEATLSSPGLDEPFKVPGQYIKNVGKTVDVVTFDGQKIVGKLAAAGTDTIEVEENSKEHELHTLNLQEIKSTRLNISFKKPKP
jgi:ribosome maturation factor RimP